MSSLPPNAGGSCFPRAADHRDTHMTHAHRKLSIKFIKIYLNEVLNESKEL